MIKGIIFDMDGVLVDNRDVHIKSFIEFARRHGVSLHPEDILWMFGKGNSDIMPAVLPAEIIEKHGIKQLGEEKEEIYREMIKTDIKALEGLYKFLDDITRHGMLCAVGSSAPLSNVEFVLEKLDIADKFKAVVNGDMVEKQKPDPSIFLKAAELLGLAPSECLVIEDAHAGLQAAANAGMKAIGMCTTYSCDELKGLPTVKLCNDFTEINYDFIAYL